MKILICSNYKDAWNSVRPEAEMFIEMAKLGHEVTIMTQGDAEYIPRFRDNGIKIIDFYPSKKICLHTIKTLRQALREHHFDVVYAMNSKTIPNAAFACIGFKHTKLVTYRGTVGGLYRHDPSAYLTHLHPRVDGISCVAQAVADDVRQRVWKHADKVVTIYKGHDIAWYQAEPADLSTLGLPDNAFTVICIANARPSKGVHVLLDSAKQLGSLHNLHLLLVGRDMDSEQHLKLAEQSGMRERIHFLGYRTDVPELLAASQVQVQPSISGEGLPKTIIEAMAMAIPSVVTITGGGKELLNDGETGFVVPTNDAGAIAEKIQWLYDSEQNRLTMGQKAQQRMINDFSCQESAKQHLAFFVTLLNE
ncbi:glycosyltransferase family 4 protein [Vibrio cholerae]|uniref:glycosyltransferase family 4 protein n=1 Tax=Vibrio TaxID=662 RepID=UPI00050CB5D1|nr:MULTISPECIES: glycosyltransferase family 4 protein [Vibrio]MCO7017338.1 glycosyltransferase family 4 protein [Vibrio paracholerae]TXX51647.1 glycosyltransferase family 4 protein [Vibrio cholerae]TXY20000.1 glycosyltransferase family 4 protein [Vibrio cholerae]TXY64484.1 glycosyltransferase family 4 protein [Vibrio cholerae]TYA54652.1 glycosyltransferase family 4 protein [Vibrio cholerae]